MSDFSNLSVLLVEPHAGMRASLHSMLSTCGLSKIEHAYNASTAIRPLKIKRFDLIFCEYDLGPGQDGQQLLEDLRNHNIIPLSTMFIMATAERLHEKVVSAAELAPTDYILKPFTVDGLQERLSRIVKKREAFLLLYQLIEQGYKREAIELCGKQEGRYKEYVAEFMRLRAQLHTELGEPAQAETIYRELIGHKNIPWARLGLAKSLFAQERYHEAALLLEALVAEHNHFLDAYDWLARTREMIGDLDQAQAVLQAAARISPHVLHRLRKLGAVALEAGDVDTAEHSLKQVVSKARYSEFRDPEDNVRLVKTLVSKGDVDQAAAQVRELEKTMSGLPKAAACQAISSAMVYETKGDRERLAAALATALQECRHTGVQLSGDIKMELARTCLENKRDEAASELIIEVMKNARSPAIVGRAMALLEEAGRPELAMPLAQESRRQVMGMVAAGADKARQGDYQGAVDMMSEAVRKLPDNPQVVYNAAVATLKYLQHMGWEDAVGEQARMLIESGRRLNLGQSRLASLVGLYDELLTKYGVRAGRTLAH